MLFRLHNSLTRSRDVFVAGDPARVTLYSCGPTVYDDAHVGNFRSFLVADVLRRWLESPLCVIRGLDGAEHRASSGRAVRHVMNITDVGHMTEDDRADGGGEDKMAIAGRRLLEAKKSGALPAGVEVDPGDPRAIASYFAGRFVGDARRLGLRVAVEAERDASVMPRATEAVGSMIEAVGALVSRGAAYVVGGAGSRAVYFDVSAAPRYGELSGNTVEALRGGAGGRVAAETLAGKRQPADFLLWKEDPKHLMRWPSPWGEGYPGWHIECTAMAFEALAAGGLSGVLSGGDGVIDAHTGGEDNKFPHHECEIAQSCALSGSRLFSRQWLHTAFLNLRGEKISKSRGNFVTPRQLMDPSHELGGHEPGAVRLALIATHYRTNADFSERALKDAARTLGRWRRVLEGAEAGGAGVPPGAGVLGEGVPGPVAEARDAFARCMADDLNVAGAIGEVNKWVGSRGEGPASAAEASFLRAADAVLGVLELGRAEARATGIAVYAGGVEPSAAIEALLAERAASRKAKDFARADAIRDELAGLGLSIKDAAGGKVEVSRGG